MDFNPTTAMVGYDVRLEFKRWTRSAAARQAYDEALRLGDPDTYTADGADVPFGEWLHSFSADVAFEDAREAAAI